MCRNGEIVIEKGYEIFNTYQVFIQRGENWDFPPPHIYEYEEKIIYIKKLAK